MKENQLDPIDIRILEELTSDARIPFVKLAGRLHVSNTLVHQRIKKLRQAGILKNATYRLDSWRLGYQTLAYTSILLTDSKYHRSVEVALSKIPQIIECANIAGRYALLAKLVAKDNRHLRSIIYDKIHVIDGVEGTNTTIAFETAFERGLPLKTVE
ncbi:MAG TPA: Lrp/AsnC family transcriptional regulator [Bacteroidetes bacterium]|nr:Lrp/AsnC family transcriptional regulator [Bacteroidota bacterium]